MCFSHTPPGHGSTPTLHLGMNCVLIWLAWLAALASNGVIVYLWVVFGLAAAGGQGADARGFIESTAVGVGLSLLISVILMARGKLAVGIVSVFSMMPLVIAFTVAYGKFIKV